MSLLPERGGEQSPSPDSVQTVPDEVKLSPELRAQGIQTVETASNANIKVGDQMVQAPANQTVAVQIPNTQTNLIAWSKGGIVDSITWLAMFWLRVIKKALARGQRVEVKN